MTESERRSTLRMPFVAYAEITEEGSTVSIAVRISDLSNDGCYVDMRSPLPKGTSVVIKLIAATDTFEAEATVAYSDPHLGMGVSFREVRSEARTILQRWLEKASEEQA
jgi:PilZ domain